VVARRIRFVSSNPGKFREVREILRPYGVEVRWSRRALPEAQADTLPEVVRSKLAPLPVTGGAYLVEDSGLFLEGLQGFPGVYSAYAYRTLGLTNILRLLKGRDRSATFRTAAGVRQGRSSWVVGGTVRGRIAERPRGDGGFGYDPIFIPTGDSRTFAEMSPEEKNGYSHRGRAIRAVGRRLVAPRSR
jgi:XTP/dITP diphosphohydrolase